MRLMAHRENSGEQLVWDLPVRLFHWILVLLIATSWISAQVGGNAMKLHEWSGIAILTMLLFRVLWGFVGSTHARFSSFLRSPRAAYRYARSLVRGEEAFFPGHNPLGAWMVVALLVSLFVQAGTGLFANDDIMIEGPLALLVSKDTSDLLTKVHHINFSVLLALVSIHVVAVVLYLWIKRENLIRPMLSGRKRIAPDRKVDPPTGGPLWLA